MKASSHPIVSTSLSGHCRRAGNQGGQLASLQIVRGLAALAVVLYHVGFISNLYQGENFLGGAFSDGHLGVDVFFVLSGFIIFYVHEADLGLPARCRPYLQKRFFRVYPLLVILTIAKLAYMYMVGVGVHREKYDINIIISSLLMLPLPPGEGHVIDVAWTLCHEMFFYVLFAIGIIFGRHLLRIMLSLWAGLIILVQLWATQPLSGLVAFILDPHNIEFCAGCLSAFFFTRCDQWRLVTKLAAGGVVAVLTAVAILAGEGELRLRLLSSGGFGLVIVLFATLEQRGRNFSRVPALVVLGDASYSIYLSHTAFLTAIILSTKRLLDSTTGAYQGGLGIAALLAVAIGVVVYRVLERPLLTFARNHWMRTSTGDCATNRVAK